MLPLLRTVPFLLLSLAACGGGGSSSSPAMPTGAAVHVAVDTATGSDAFVQFQVAAAAFERADGSTTRNVLPAPRMVTFASPTGEIEGVSLRDVPGGDYTQLHLMLVPGSGFARYGDGSASSVQSAVDVVVPIAAGLQVADGQRSVMAVAHTGSAPPAGNGATVAWTPVLGARTDGSPHSLDALQVVLVGGTSVMTAWSRGDDTPIGVEFAPGCACFDGSTQLGSSDDFLHLLGSDDRLRVRGELHRSGRLVAHEAERHHGLEDNHTIGRITELRPASATFLFAVQAQVAPGGMQPSNGTTTVLVSTAQAVLRTHHHLPIAFGDLQVGQLAKVEWTSSTTGAGGVTELVAREVEVLGEAEQPTAEWQGFVQAVDVGGGTITVVPWHDDPIVVGGTAVPQVTLTITNATALLRAAAQGGALTAIGLGDVNAGQDRIWWQGTANGAATITATWVRVRAQ